MALAYSHRGHELYHLPDYDCYVYSAGSYPSSRSIRPSFVHSSEPLCHIILFVLYPNDICGCLGLRQVFYEQSFEVGNHTPVFWCHDKNALSYHGLLLASAPWHYFASLCGPLYHQLLVSDLQ